MATKTLFKSNTDGKGADLVGNYGIENPRWDWMEDTFNRAMMPLKSLINTMDEAMDDEKIDDVILMKTAYEHLKKQLHAVAEVLEDNLGQIQIVIKPGRMDWFHVDPKNMIGIETVDFSGKHQQDEQDADR